MQYSACIRSKSKADNKIAV